MFPLFDLSLQLNGFPMKEAKAELRKIVNLSNEDHKIFIETKKQEIVKFHLENNSFYQQLVGSKTYGEWNYLPILNKTNLQSPLLERLSKGYSQKDIFLNKTSGSSGTPFIFAKDNYCHALTWASIIYRFGWYGIDFNNSYQARFYGIPMDFIGNKKERFKDFLSHRFRFPIFDLSDEVLEGFLNHFRIKKFDYINGYTSSIVLFAKFLQNKNIVLTTICPTLKVCMVTSEMLFEEDKILLQKQLGVPIINEYGASELDLIAFENTKGEWLLNTETIFVEILNENNEALPYGKEGRIVITSLYNKAHPFIRYEVGDYGIIDEKSTTKKTILKKLIGRNNDVAVLPSGKKAPGMTFYSITKKLFGDEGNVKEFIIKQTKIDVFEIEYTSEKELTNLEINNIETIFSNYLEPNLNYIFIRKEKLERGKSGKLKQFISMI